MEIDRPLGSKHPNHDFVYPVNYGFVPDTQAGDGEPIDAYVLGPREPVAHFEGICIGVILRFDDDEHKLVVAADVLPVERIQEETDFVEQYYETEYVVLREDRVSD